MDLFHGIIMKIKGDNAYQLLTQCVAHGGSQQIVAINYENCLNFDALICQEECLWRFVCIFSITLDYESLECKDKNVIFEHSHS